MKIVNVCGARPNFMKIAPLMRVFHARPEFTPILVHTGQHYDAALSKAFFDDLHLPRPDVNLEVGSASHAVQTAAIMQKFESVVLEQQPDAVLVVGDVNSTIACALVASKLHIQVIHVEAGLRSFDRRMPEEINRVLTDAISDVLFVTEPAGVKNLRHEGVPDDKIHLVGNVMIDTLRAHETLAEQSEVLGCLGLEAGTFGIVTLHRPATVDVPAVFSEVLAALGEISQELPLVFPVHPRTRARLTAAGFDERLAALPQLRLINPVGYLDFLKLMKSARVVLTDSGGIQEETTVLGVPCLTLRENTERPITIEQGTNRLVGLDRAAILAAFHAARCDDTPHRIPELWDGKAAERIADVLLQRPM